MDDRAAEYRGKLEELRRRGGARWRTPVGLRDEITVWAGKLRGEGHPLGRWLTLSGRSAGELRRVRVVEVGSVPERLVVVTPAGYRLEGLSVDQAVDVLRRL
jgi:hypothetical protein